MTRRPADVINAVLYGVINAILAIPALFGYAAVIFSDGAYVDVAAPLAKAVVLSAAVHQCVSWRARSLAIGQVQDAGLIFPSKMATDVARALGGSARRRRDGAVWIGAEYGIVRTGPGRRRPRAHDGLVPICCCRLGRIPRLYWSFCIEAGPSLCIGAAPEWP